MEDTYCVIVDPKSTTDPFMKGLQIVNFAVQDEVPIFTGTLQECEDYVECPEFPNRDAFWPSRRWNKDYSDYTDLSGQGDTVLQDL